MKRWRGGVVKRRYGGEVVYLRFQVFCCYPYVCSFSFTLFSCRVGKSGLRTINLPRHQSAFAHRSSFFAPQWWAKAADSEADRRLSPLLPTLPLRFTHPILRHSNTPFFIRSTCHKKTRSVWYAFPRRAWERGQVCKTVLRPRAAPRPSELRLHGDRPGILLIIVILHV